MLIAMNSDAQIFPPEPPAHQSWDALHLGAWLSQRRGKARGLPWPIKGSELAWLRSLEPSAPEWMEPPLAGAPNALCLAALDPSALGWLLSQESSAQALSAQRETLPCLISAWLSKDRNPGPRSPYTMAYSEAFARCCALSAAICLARLDDALERSVASAWSVEGASPPPRFAARLLRAVFETAALSEATAPDPSAEEARPVASEGGRAGRL